jgi:chromate transporter
MLADSFYRSGALVFGGGHVVLPLLHEEMVPTRHISEQRFIAGYGAAQLVPGPLFTFAAYLGAVIDDVAGAIVATTAIFLPGFLLVFAALPSWGAIRAKPWAQSALRGVNAAVVGLLLAALVDIARAIASTLI